MYINKDVYIYIYIYIYLYIYIYIGLTDELPRKCCLCDEVPFKTKGEMEARRLGLREMRADIQSPSRARPPARGSALPSPLRTSASTKARRPPSGSTGDIASRAAPLPLPIEHRQARLQSVDRALGHRVGARAHELVL